MKNILVIVSKKFARGGSSLYLTKCFTNEKLAKEFITSYKQKGYIVETV